jgi:cysteinyl-tRNA synthetase
MAAKRQQPQWNAPTPSSSRKELHIYNSLTNSKVKFIPEKGNNVSWYICGPTVYDSSHLGHARNYVTFDIIRRILEDYFGYHVSAVMNITDVDDKIILRARRNFLFAKYVEENKEWSDLVRADLREAFDTYKSKMEGKIGDLKGEAEKLKVAKQSQAAHTAELEAVLLESFLKNANSAEEHLKKIVAGGDTTSFNDFSKSAFDPLSELLDKRHGSTVNDQEVFRKHAAYYEKEYLEDMLTLGIRPPDVLTRVSEYVTEIIDSTKKIIDNGFAYESNGSVYFDTQSFSSKGHFYAKLEPTSVGNEKLASEVCSSTSFFLPIHFS